MRAYPDTIIADLQGNAITCLGRIFLLRVELFYKEKADSTESASILLVRKESNAIVCDFGNEVDYPENEINGGNESKNANN